MNFINWLLLNENVETNFDYWAKAIIKYEKPSEETILRSLGLYSAELFHYSLSLGTDKDGKPIIADPVGSIVFAFNTRFKKYKDIIIKVLKNKHLENLNWLSFSIGFLAAKFFQEEDLELAIDVTKRRIDNGELPKSEIGSKGWMVIGKESLEHVKEYLRQQQEISNRQKLKLKKSGETLEEDKNLIQLVASENDLRLYLLPKLNVDSKNVEKAFNALSDDNTKFKIEARKRLLCKYGKGTDWCTANPSGEYDRYYVNNDIYIVHENDAPKYQFTGCGSSSNPQFMDVKDNYVEEITLHEKEFLDNHADIGCYSFEIVFPNLKSFQGAKRELQEKISTKSILNFVETQRDRDYFKTLPKEEIEKLFAILETSNMTSEVLSEFLSKLPNNFVDFFDDEKIIDIIKKLQYIDYNLLNKKLSSERLEDILSHYSNNSHTGEEDYIANKINSRKKTIRRLIEDALNLKNSYKLLEFLTDKIKINIGKEEAYTILDSMIVKIARVTGFISDYDRELNSFSKAFGKENINKIDLERFSERMKVELIPDGGKYKIKLPKDWIEHRKWADRGLAAKNMYKELMVDFLVKHNDNISGVIEK